MTQTPEDLDLLEQSAASMAAGDHSAALVAANAAIEVSRLADDTAADLAKALRLKALALEGLGRSDEAMDAWAEARTFLQGLGDLSALAECDARLNR